MTSQKVYLVGAGPGDPDLLTVKAYKILKEADIVFYDALVNPEILSLIPTWGRKVFVGKRRGYKKYEQSEINNLLVKAIQSGNRNVVRLKGGDPLVFARSLEEMEVLKQHNIAYEIIPGISSYAAAVAENNIPLTQRNVNQSFWVLTGTTSKNVMNKEIYLAAQSNATVIVLMGMQFLPKIIAEFKKHHNGSLNVGIMQNVSCESKRSVFGTLDNIIEKKDEKQISNPAVIVIGKTLEWREENLSPVYQTPIDSFVSLKIS